MAQTALTPDLVEKAEAGVIETSTLRLVRDAAHDLRWDNLTPSGAALLVLCVGPLLDELLAHRERAAAACELSPPPPDNVVALRGPV